MHYEKSHDISAIGEEPMILFSYYRRVDMPVWLWIGCLSSIREQQKYGGSTRMRKGLLQVEDRVTAT